jgi:hypothetical protein
VHVSIVANQVGASYALAAKPHELDYPRAPGRLSIVLTSPAGSTSNVSSPQHHSLFFIVRKSSRFHCRIDCGPPTSNADVGIRDPMPTFELCR